MDFAVWAFTILERSDKNEQTPPQYLPMVPDTGLEPVTPTV